MTDYRLSDNDKIFDWRISAFEFKSSSQCWMTAFKIIFDFDFSANLTVDESMSLIHIIIVLILMSDFFDDLAL